MWFVRLLREACDAALEDGVVGSQTGHIERVEVTDPGHGKSHITLSVVTWDDFSIEECRSEDLERSVLEVMNQVSNYMAARALSRIDGFDDLIN